MSPLRTEILATLLEILSDFPLPNQNPGYAADGNINKEFFKTLRKASKFAIQF